MAEVSDSPAETACEHGADYGIGGGMRKCVMCGQTFAADPVSPVDSPAFDLGNYPATVEAGVRLGGASSVAANDGEAQP